MRVVVGSTNPVKTEAARGACKRMYPSAEVEIVSVSVPSCVSDQPRSDGETLRGAQNRAIGARDAKPGADFWIGIEGGIDIQKHEVTAFAWAVVLSPTREGKSRTATFNLPRQICRLIERGKTLSEAVDEVFATEGSGTTEGAIGLFTGGAVTRTSYHEEAVLLALIPHKYSHMYK